MKVRLGDYIEQIRGVSYSPEDLHSALNANSVILLRANNINDNKINFDDVVFVDKSKVSKKQYLQEGDILICASSGSKHLVGKAAYIDKAQPVTFGAFCKIVRPKTSIKRYIGYFFESPFYRTRISELSGGANINNIKNEHIDNLEFELLEDRTQNDICSKLNKISFIIDKRKQQLEKLDLLVKSQFIEMFGDPVKNDRAWKLCTLESISDIGSSKRIFEREYVEKGVPFFRTKEVVELSKGEEITTELYISKERFREIQKEYGCPTKGDLLISAVGTIGVIWIVDGREFYFKDGNLLQVRTKLNSQFLKYILERLIADYKQEMANGTAYAALTISNLKKMRIINVPIIIQNKFASFVEQTDKTKSKIKQSLERFDILKKALMQKYFG